MPANEIAIVLLAVAAEIALVFAALEWLAR